LLRIGDIAFIGFAGEMFNSIGTAVVEKAGVPHAIWCNVNSNAYGISSGYVPDDATIEAGGAYGAIPVVPGHVLDAMVTLVNKLINK
jgi:hypothetical protein